ncbi:Lipopolysaccharide biosynthesis chain length determinant protein [Minicystis rosea]|nr:Lipopolysaccharide biosynthesis chain length determinant protein [Minicystis rosea]
MNAPIDNPTTNTRLARVKLPTTPAPAGAMPAAQPAQPEVDVGAMIRRVLAHWQVVIVTLVLGGVITSQVVRARMPSYKSETVIFYREGLTRVFTAPGERGDTVDLRQLGTKLKETLLAQQTLRQLIDEFHLYPDTVSQSGYADAVDQMRKKSDFKSRSQDTFAISFEGTDRDQAQKVCARMAEILIRAVATRTADDNRSASDFLVVEKRRADEELDRTEREISAFLAAHPEFLNAREGLGAEVLFRQKAEDERRRRKPASPLAGRPRRGRGDAPPMGLPLPRGAAAVVDPVLLGARSQAMTELMNARRDLAEKTLKYTDQHPDVKAAQARVTVAEQSLRGAEEAIDAAMPKEEAPPPPRKVANIDDPYGEDAGAARTTDNPEGADDKPKATTDHGDKAVSLEVEWARLQRSLAVVRTRQADLDHKLYKAELNASTNEGGYGSTIAVLDPAYRPSTPSNAPNRTIVLIGLGASIALGLVLSAAWGLFLDDRVFSPLEIETIVMVPVLGSVPRDEKKANKKKGKHDKSKGLGTARVATDSMRGSGRG